MELITRMAYCNRDQVKSALDFMETARVNAQVDRAITASAENIEGFMHRVFYPLDTTRYWDWPNFQYAYPWRVWFDRHDLVNATIVTTGGTSIPLGNLFFEPVNKLPDEPYEYMELNRSTSSSFGTGSTPQRDVAVTGTWGYSAVTDPVGSLTAAVSSTSATTLVVSDASLIGVGDLVVIDAERILLQDSSTADTGQTNVAGATTAEMKDQAIGVTSGTAIHAGELIQIDSERMLVVDVTGTTVTVKRAFDGSVLATHSAGTAIYAFRTFTCARGMYGTTAGTHTQSTVIGRHRVPAMIRNLSLAESVNSVLQEQSGYARMVGGADMAVAAPGAALADLWDEARTRYGRKSRRRGI